MGRIIKGVIVIAIAGLIVWQAGSFYLERKLTKQLDELIVIASDMANIHYDQINVYPTGTISLSHLTITPLEDNDYPPVTMEKASVTFPNVVYMTKVALGKAETKMPESLTVNLEGLNSQDDDIQSLFDATSNINKLLKEHIIPVCGDTFFMTGNDFEAMGYKSSTMNHSLHYTFDEITKTLEASITSIWPDIGSVELAAKISHLDGLSPAKLIRTPQLEKITLEFKDGGYISKAVNHCAQKAELSPQDYIQKETSQPDLYYQLTWGVIPNDTLKKAYRGFLNNPQTLTLSAIPAPGQDIARIAELAPDYWVDYLGLSLKINDQIITPLEIKAGKLKELISLANKPQKKQRQPSDIITEKSAIQAPTHSYQLIQKNNLANAIKSRARIKTNHGQTFEGIILSADNNTVVLEYWLSGGTATLPIKYDRIVSVEIWK